MNVQQLVSPKLEVVPTTAKKVKGGKSTPKPSPLALQIEALRLELTSLTNAPCSPLMGVESLTKAIAKAKLPPPAPTLEEIQEDFVDDYPGSEVKPLKTKVIPSKPQGIGAHCVTQLKSGMKPKDVLEDVKSKFPSAKTSMACIYWYQSKISQGLL
jgi:hypothetical protein